MGELRIPGGRAGRDADAVYHDAVHIRQGHGRQRQQILCVGVCGMQGKAGKRIGGRWSVFQDDVQHRIQARKRHIRADGDARGRIAGGILLQGKARIWNGRGKTAPQRKEFRR